MAKLHPLFYIFNRNGEEIHIFCRMLGLKAPLQIMEDAL